jgi:hypothetical protein
MAAANNGPHTIFTNIDDVNEYLSDLDNYIYLHLWTFKTPTLF